MLYCSVYVCYFFCVVFLKLRRLTFLSTTYSRFLKTLSVKRYSVWKYYNWVFWGITDRSR